MSATTQIKMLFIQNRLRICITYSLVILENIGSILTPLVIGYAINRLIKQRYDGLVFLIIGWIVLVSIATFRRLYDTHTFATIYGQLATQVVLKQRGQETSNSKVIARAALAKELVDFFERDIPTMMGATSTLVGAVVMLSIIDGISGLSSLLLLFPLGIINYFNFKQSHALHSKLNNEVEREADVIVDSTPDGVIEHFTLLAKWRVKLSNLEATNFGTMEIFVLGLVVIVLSRNAVADSKPGDVYAVLAYVFNFIGGLDAVPLLVQQMGRLRDIGQRTYSEEDFESQ